MTEGTIQAPLRVVCVLLMIAYLISIYLHNRRYKAAFCELVSVQHFPHFSEGHFQLVFHNEDYYETPSALSAKLK